MEQQPDRRRGRQPGRQHADGEQPANQRSGSPPTLDLEGQATLEEDDADCCRHDQLEELAEARGLNDAEPCRPEQNPSQEQQDDGGDLQAPGDGGHRP